MKKLMCLLLCSALTFGVCAGLSGCAEKLDPNKIYISVDDRVTDSIGINSWISRRQEQFEKDYPDIVVDHQAGATSTSSQIQDAVNNLSGGRPLTALKINSNHYARQISGTGLIEDWLPYLEDYADLENLDPVVREGYTVNGELIGFPISVEYPLLGFRRDILKERGMTDEEIDALSFDTWEEYRQFVKGIATDDVSGMGMLLQDFYNTFVNWNIANGYNIATQNDDGTMALNFTDTATVETLQFLKDVYADGSVAQNLNISTADFYSAIFNGSVASFTFYPSWTTWFSDSGVDVDQLRLMPFPKGPSLQNTEEAASSVVYPVGYVLNSRASEEEKQAAATYITYMYGKEAWEDRMQYAAEMEIRQVVQPPYQDINWELIALDLPEDWVAAMRAASQSNFTINYDSSAFASYLQPYLASIVSGDDDMMDTLRSAQNTATNEWLNSYNDNILS